jgi:recombinational DNA repair protein RecR
VTENQAKCVVCGERWSKPLCDACRDKGYDREGTVIMLNGKPCGGCTVTENQEAR